MHAFSIISAALCGSSALVSAVATPRVLTMPDLPAVAPPVKYSFTTTASTTCDNVASNYQQLAGSIAAALIKSSGGVDQTCSVTQNDMNENTFFGIRTGGFEIASVKCDTSSDVATVQKNIQAALETYFKLLDYNICGVQCIYLTLGGVWQGYLTIGPVSVGQVAFGRFVCNDNTPFSGSGLGGSWAEIL